MVENDSRTAKKPQFIIFRLHMVYRLHMCARIGAASLAALARLGGD